MGPQAVASPFSAESSATPAGIGTLEQHQQSVYVIKCSSPNSLSSSPPSLSSSLPRYIRGG